MAKPPGRTPAAGPQPTVRGRKAETRAANEACRLLRTSPHARGAGPGAVQTPRSVPPKPPRPRGPVGRWQAGGGGSPPPPGARPVWPPGKPLGGGLGPGTHASSPPGSPLPTETCRSQGHAHGGRSGARTGAGQGRAHGGRSGARAGPVRGAHGGRTASGRRTPEKPASPGSPRPHGGQAGRALPRPPRLLHEPLWVRRSGLRGRGHWGSGLQGGDSRNLGSGVDALGGSQHAHALESGFAHVSS